MSKPSNLPMPAEQSDADIQRSRDKALKIAKRIEATLQRGRKVSWDLAAALYAFREERGWLALGYEKLGDWLAEPEIGLSWATFDRMIRIHREFVIQRGLDSSALTKMDPSKADIVLPALKAGDVLLQDAKADVESLAWRDLREKYVKPSEDEPAEPEPPANEVLGEPQSDVEGEVVEGEVIGVGDTRDLSAAEAGELDDALGDWHLLLNELREAAVSGQDFPRVSAIGIQPGLEALEKLIASAVDVDLVMEN